MGGGDTEAYRDAVVDLLGAGVLGDGLGALRDGVLGELTREEEPDRGLDLAGRGGGLGVVLGNLGRPPPLRDPDWAVFTLAGDVVVAGGVRSAPTHPYACRPITNAQPRARNAISGPTARLHEAREPTRDRQDAGQSDRAVLSPTQGCENRQAVRPRE